MDKISKETLSRNIENKLDEFFSEDEPPSESQLSSVSLEKLKTTVLSIDWEITDECLSELVAETDLLLESYQDDRPTNALLRMLKALANYIKKHKAQAHQEAIKRVMSVYASIESIIEQYGLDDTQKRKIVAAEINAFHLLKDQIRSQRSTSDANRNTTTAPPAKASPDPEKQQAQRVNDMTQVLSDFESKIYDQIDQLKSQLADIKTEMANYIKK